MRFILKDPGGVEYRIDVPGASPADHELVGAWLHRIFASMTGDPSYWAPIEYILKVS
jgi:hypothetical protein